MGVLKEKKGLQGRWPKTLSVFILPFVCFFLFRAFAFEPFVIPSESMLPNLLVHDHIIVNKHDYGLKFLWGDGWLVKFKQPSRGDVVVFRYPVNRNVFYIKRLIGLPGDEIIVRGMSVTVNGELYALEPTTHLNIFQESNGSKTYDVMYASELEQENEESKKYTVPEGSYFVMGDNRYNSQDSRYWGMLSSDLLVGKAIYTWLSCDEMLESAPFICNLQTIRKERLLKKID